MAKINAYSTLYDKVTVYPGTSSDMLVDFKTVLLDNASGKEYIRTVK